ncbi:hypothetical protein [Microbacterium sp. Root180]|uniref:hypothetical protein n=1 Tax=Microbacterium sp. Root180 TaxID=1736483 RepID=UPI0006FA0372|nr:hypothetical protein [Microbacterium sp. Root180]KRB36399.1 hypothetical protein ASD93_09990 [Microbacterium sp. Root180]
MSTTLPSQQGTAPGGDRPRATVRRRVWLTVLVVAIVGAVIGGSVVFAWMVDETHFDRPSQEFDQFAAEVESLPGVQSVEKERWVEAPTFSNPTSWMFVTVDRSGLPAVFDAACATDYPDPVSWSFRVQTPASAEVMLHATSAVPDAVSGDGRCPDFGFDAAPLVDELDRVAPGLTIQPIMWDVDKLALVAIEDELPNGFTHLLPLVEHADRLVAAAGVDPNEEVEINSANLGLVFEPRERGAYLALLAELAEDLGVTSFYADGGGAMADGKAIVQVVAPPSQHAAIEDAIQSSGLAVADYPIRFLEQ